MKALAEDMRVAMMQGAAAEIICNRSSFRQAIDCDGSGRCENPDRTRSEVLECGR
jgi:hypothetical protein